MSDKVKIKLRKETIKQSASMVDVMMANGSLYEDHPLVILIKEIVDECLKIKKGGKKDGKR